MTYFQRWGLYHAARVGFFVILIHGLVCGIAVLGFFGIILQIVHLVQDASLSHELVNGAQKLTVALVNRDQEGWVLNGKFACQVALPDPRARSSHPKSVATTCVRDQPVDKLQTLQVFIHPSLTDGSSGKYRAVEVPENLTWQNVYHSINGRTVGSMIFQISVLFGFFSLVAWVAMWGYRRIKYGRNSGRHGQHRHGYRR